MPACRYSGGTPRGETIFYYDVEDEAWRISTRDGHEVSVPESDMLGFLRHCAAGAYRPPVDRATNE